MDTLPLTLRCQTTSRCVMFTQRKIIPTVFNFRLHSHLKKKNWQTYFTIITIITIRGKQKIPLLVFSDLKYGIPYEVAWTKTAVLFLSYKRPDTWEATCVTTNEQNMMNVIFCHSGEFVKQAVIHTSSQCASIPTPNIELKLLCHRATI